MPAEGTRRQGPTTEGSREIRGMWLESGAPSESKGVVEVFQEDFQRTGTGASKAEGVAEVHPGAGEDERQVQGGCGGEPRG